MEAEAFRLEVGAHKTQRGVMGIGRGLHVFAVAANSEGEQSWRSIAPKPLCTNLRRLRRLSRRLSRKKPYSKNRSRARRRLGGLHHGFSNIRRAHVHALTRHVAQTHSHVSLEDLHIAGLLRNHSPARRIADSCWGLFAQQLRYKAPWCSCEVSSVNRFAPTSKTFCRCDWGWISCRLGCAPMRAPPAGGAPTVM